MSGNLIAVKLIADSVRFFSEEIGLKIYWLFFFHITSAIGSIVIATITVLSIVTKFK